jgi:hypothetical protein
MAPRPRLRDDLVIRQVEDQFVVYDPVEDVTSLLNASAALVMDLCDGTRTQQEIALEVANVFGLDVDLVRDDVREACSDFSTRGFFAD